MSQNPSFAPLALAIISAFAITSCYPAIAPTIANLNTVHIWPSTDPIIPGLKYKKIPGWFEYIKKNGFPAQGGIVSPENKKRPVWRFASGLPSGKNCPIVIHSGPRDDTLGRLKNGRLGHGFRCTNAWIKNGIINGPFITFDYFFDADEFDFGQGVNIASLKTIYDATTTKNPQAPLIIAGTCIGAKIALELASRYQPQNLQALILESPFINVKKVMRNWAKKYMGWIPFADQDAKDSMITSTLGVYFSDFESTVNRAPANISQIDPKMPIFIAHLQGDSFCSDQEMLEIVQQLAKYGNTNIYLLIIKDPKLSHGRLGNKKEFCLAINAFLAAHNLPHTPEFSQQGKELLAKARCNAQAKNIAEWKIVKAS